MCNSRTVCGDDVVKYRLKPFLQSYSMEIDDGGDKQGRRKMAALFSTHAHDNGATGIQRRGGKGVCPPRR